MKTANFKTGEVVRIELVYEKLLKVCFICKRLTHDKSVCPYQIDEYPDVSRGKSGMRKAVKIKG